ncbi:MAG TPA: hypothetical protein VGD42_16215 [Lysobacter sp.]
MTRLDAAWMVVLAASAFSMPAQADGGRITFRGAVVAPTCAPGLAVAAAPISTRARCPDTSAATRYTLRVEPATAALRDSQLISYFDGYLRANGSSAWLATQQYE